MKIILNFSFCKWNVIGAQPYSFVYMQLFCCVIVNKWDHNGSKTWKIYLMALYGKSPCAPSSNHYAILLRKSKNEKENNGINEVKVEATWP